MSGNLVNELGESELMLAGFGLGELTVAILSLSVLHSFNKSSTQKFEELYLDGHQDKLQVLLN